MKADQGPLWPLLTAGPERSQGCSFKTVDGIGKSWQSAARLVGLLALARPHLEQGLRSGCTLSRDVDKMELVQKEEMVKGPGDEEENSQSRALAEKRGKHRTFEWLSSCWWPLPDPGGMFNAGDFGSDTPMPCRNQESGLVFADKLEKCRRGWFLNWGAWTKDSLTL